MYSKTLTRPAVTLAVSALGLMLVAAPALSAPRHGAGARPQATQRHAPAGNHQRETVRQRTPDGYTSHTTWQNGRGETATRDVVVTRDREAGTRTRSVDATGFDGRTRSVDSTRTRLENGFESSTTITTPNGSTRTREVTVIRDPVNHTVTTTVEHSRTPGPNGG